MNKGDKIFLGIVQTLIAAGIIGLVSAVTNLRADVSALRTDVAVLQTKIERLAHEKIASR